MTFKKPEYNYTNKRWYIGVENSGRDYLHKDGAIRDSTKNKSGKWTGYFKTKKKALKAIKKYEEGPNEQK